MPAMPKPAEPSMPERASTRQRDGGVKPRPAARSVVVAGAVAVVVAVPGRVVPATVIAVTVTRR